MEAQRKEAERSVEREQRDALMSRVFGGEIHAPRHAITQVDSWLSNRQLLREDRPLLGALRGGRAPGAAGQRGLDRA